MTFGEALEALKKGCRIARLGWNGKDMYLYLDDSLVASNGAKYEPCIVMFTAQGTFQPGWLASQSDMLANDWGVLLANSFKV